MYRVIVVCDLCRHQITFQSDLGLATVPRASMVAYERIILKGWESLDAYPQNRKHFLIFPVTYIGINHGALCSSDLGSQVWKIRGIHLIDVHVLGPFWQ